MADPDEMSHVGASRLEDFGGGNVFFERDVQEAVTRILKPDGSIIAKPLSYPLDSVVAWLRSSDQLTPQQIGRALLAVFADVQTLPVESESDQVFECAIQCAQCVEFVLIKVPLDHSEDIEKIRDSHFSCDACFPTVFYNEYMSKVPTALTGGQNAEIEAAAFATLTQESPTSSQMDEHKAEADLGPHELTAEQVKKCEASAREDCTRDMATPQLTEDQIKSCRDAADSEYYRPHGIHTPGTRASTVNRQQREVDALQKSKQRALQDRLRRDGSGLGRDAAEQLSREVQKLTKIKQKELLLKLQQQQKAAIVTPGQRFVAQVDKLALRMKRAELAKIQAEYKAAYVRPELPDWKVASQITRPPPNSEDERTISHAMATAQSIELAEASFMLDEESDVDETISNADLDAGVAAESHQNPEMVDIVGADGPKHDGKSTSGSMNPGARSPTEPTPTCTDQHIAEDERSEAGEIDKAPSGLTKYTEALRFSGEGDATRGHTNQHPPRTSQKDDRGPVKPMSALAEGAEPFHPNGGGGGLKATFEHYLKRKQEADEELTSRKKSKPEPVSPPN